MSNQDDPSQSFMRRKLNEDSTPDDPRPDENAGPQEKKTERTGGMLSPIRPTFQDDSQPQEPLAPSFPERTSSKPFGPASSFSPRDQMQRAEEALIHLREKMAQVAAEFAQGKLNRAQFDAIYARYSEQRVITERLLARNPDSQAWQSVMQPGHTTFLKQQFEAHLVSYAIYDQIAFAQIVITGTVQLDQAQIEAVLRRLTMVIAQRGDPGPATKKISDGRYVLFVPGEFTTAVAIFSLEPSAVQIARTQDVHRDFERANQHMLRHQDYEGERMVFPHRALFEDKKP